ncbi:melanization protease 1 [Monomorium pharaonis]|uniref:melanization protease 1 n=1 Tax=Monomorium pharaonis TaxID=307658 RepID=UPI00063FA4E5|nr:melanization protease 1 [Monomorium pharaonis]
MVLIGSLVLILTVTTINAQFQCSDRNANCVSILNCPEMLSILRGPKPFSAQTLETLKNAQCGSEGRYPKVCCNQQQVDKEMTIRETSENTPNPPDVTNHPNLRLLDHQACGPITRPKVVNGNKTAIFEYPWMALITYQRTGKPNPEYLCGGSIISSRYILTAAHCVTLLPSDVRLIGVRIGEHDISKERDCETDLNGREVVCAERYQDLDVDSFYFHPGYTKTKQQNDIALIRVNVTMSFTPQNVKPICLPFGSAINLTKKKAVVTGWGLTEYDLTSSELLQAKLPIVPNDRCEEIYKPSKEIWYKQLCAGGQMAVDSCNGDSGGPLQASSKYNNLIMRIVQYGIVSYGMTPCGIEGIPGVYTNVAYYMDWILNTMTD